MLVASNPLIQVKPGLMIWTIICFGIAFYVLRRYAFGPIQSAWPSGSDMGITGGEAERYNPSGHCGSASGLSPRDER